MAMMIQPVLASLAQPLVGVCHEGFLGAELAVTHQLIQQPHLYRQILTFQQPGSGPWWPTDLRSPCALHPCRSPVQRLGGPDRHMLAPERGGTAGGSALP